MIDLQDHQLKTIHTHGPYPAPRKFQSVVRYFEDVYVIGGWTGTPEGLDLSDEVWKLDLSTMTWSKCSTRLKMSHFFHASAITPDGCLYIFGGSIDKSMYPSNKLQRAWMRPPKLQYMAMFSLLKSNQSFKNGQNEEVCYIETIKFMKHAVNR